MATGTPTREPDDAASSARQTQRYLRLSLVLLIAVLFIGVAIQTVVVSWTPLRLGWQVLPSISHYFYTPARPVFVGVMIAAAVALLALSGRRTPSAFLDAAAIFAPLIAIVPTAISTPASGELACAPAPCVPADILPTVRVGVATYVVTVLLVVIVLSALRRRKRIAVTRSFVIVSAVAVLTALGLAVLAFVPGVSDGFPFNLWPIGSIHFAAVLLFFGCFAVVPLVYGWQPAEPDETPPTSRQRLIYRLVAVLMGTDLLFLVLAFLARGQGWALFGTVPVALIGEVVALLLFAWFWWEQTLQRWDDVVGPFALPPAGTSAPTESAGHGTT
ncbi:hypothetical protein [Microbacterium sp. JZ31]|uniref:hypothetical protein n=1 Tax=Microbacterium sp. JZ31 TaxID=1906274 RepID=UPI001931D404|nr:hypothetical protein [Microbacterium sp. JZ31]